MVVVRQRKMSIFVDKSSGQWIVRDADGAFWTVPADEEGWKHREPFTLTEEGLSRYFEFYTQKRRHSSLENRTPAEVYFDPGLSSRS